MDLKEARDKLIAMGATLQNVLLGIDKMISRDSATQWQRWVAAVAASDKIPAPIKASVVAQSIVETGRGTSELFKRHNNPLGMKYREELAQVAKAVTLSVTSEASGSAIFCGFDSPEEAVLGWAAFIARLPYNGWEQKASDAIEFLRFVCPIWAADTNYLQKCLSVLPEAQELLGQKPGATPAPAPAPAPALKVDEVKLSPNNSERGATISTIVLHNTSGSYAGSLSWLTNAVSKVSAHLLISRSGKVAQMVPFEKRAWHAGNSRINANSIGIEIEATPNQRGLTDAQNRVLVQWCQELMKRYKIPVSQVGIHRMYSSTDCPSLIWPKDSDFLEWRKKHLE